MIKVDKDLLNIPRILKEENREKAFDENIKAKDYVDKSNLYKVASVQKALEKIYNFKCAYCEKDIRDEDKHIEHYRPKSRYYWLAYSWDNLLLSCGQCNRPKGTRFLTQKCSVLYYDEEFKSIHSKGNSYDEIEEPMIINPEKDDILEDIVFDNKAKISSKNKRVQHTIDEACNLNRNGLVENRIKVFNTFKRRVITNIESQNIIGLKNEIENFIEECQIENEYYAFKYFILKHSDIFFSNSKALNDLINKLNKETKK